MDNKNVFEEAKSLISGEKASCVVIKSDEMVAVLDGRGVSPLLGLYNTEFEKLKGAFVVDRIIGKAAAMILVLGGVIKAYGEIMSVPAYNYLIKHGVDVSYGSCIDAITARDGRGICPIEKSVLDIEDPREGLAKIIETIESFPKQV